MTFPTSDVNTSNADAGTDSPATFRSDVLDLITKFNLLRNHFSTLGQSLISRATAVLARQDLGATTVGDAVFTAADAAAARTAIGAQASLGYTPANDSSVVKLTGVQTVAGVKTFSSQPVLPQAPTLGTAVNTTSGTAIDFTGIPSWARRITLMFNGVSTTGSSSYLVQIGSGSFTASGYLGSVNLLGVNATNYSTGFMVANTVSPSCVSHGAIQLQHMGGNIWTQVGLLGRSDAANDYVSAGQVPLAGVLDRLRLTTVGGTDTFDAGSVNIYYE